MTITHEELRRYNIKFENVVATDNSEEYIIFTGQKESVREGNVHRIGRIIIQYPMVETGEEFVQSALLLNEKCEDTAISYLKQVIDRRVVDKIGAGYALSRHDFSMEVYLIEEYLGDWVDRVESEQ